MKEILGHFRQYFLEIDKRVLLVSSGFLATLVWANYHLGIDDHISSFSSGFFTFFHWYLVFFIAFLLPYLFYVFFTGKRYFQQPGFVFLIMLSPAIFAAKMTINSYFKFSESLQWNEYWNYINYWPFRLVIMTLFLFIIWKLFYRNDSFFGLTVKKFHWRPYLILLALMIPLIAAASTQKDFLSVYPKLKMISESIANLDNKWLYKLLFEISYGSDFISVELFFRGFLILAFLKYAGKDAILPMACFYCCIHFGKPLGECISSYFGGILLGVVVYHTRSIYGGLMVHLGIAWLMELGGYWGNLF